MEQTDNKYLRPRELAQRWGVSQSMAYKLAEDGAVPALRINGTLRFPLAAVEAYERAHGLSSPQSVHQFL